MKVRLYDLWVDVARIKIHFSSSRRQIPRFIYLFILVQCESAFKQYKYSTTALMKMNSSVLYKSNHSQDQLEPKVMKDLFTKGSCRSRVFLELLGHSPQFTIHSKGPKLQVYLPWLRVCPFGTADLLWEANTRVMAAIFGP